MTTTGGETAVPGRVHHLPISPSADAEAGTLSIDLFPDSPPASAAARCSLVVSFTPSYPLFEPPVAELRAPFLDGPTQDSIMDALQRQFEENGPEVIVYTVMSVLVTISG